MHTWFMTENFKQHIEQNYDIDIIKTTNIMISYQSCIPSAHQSIPFQKTGKTLLQLARCKLSMYCDGLDIIVLNCHRKAGNHLYNHQKKDGGTIHLLFISSKFDFSSAILRQENSVAFLQSNRDQLALPVTLTRANSHHFGSIQLQPVQNFKLMN